MCIVTDSVGTSSMGLIMGIQCKAGPYSSLRTCWDSRKLLQTLMPFSLLLLGAESLDLACYYRMFIYLLRNNFLQSLLKIPQVPFRCSKIQKMRINSFLDITVASGLQKFLFVAVKWGAAPFLSAVSLQSRSLLIFKFVRMSA